MSQFGLDSSEQLPAVKEETGFHNEISSMMHGFGDNPSPNEASVAMVESIVLQQLRLMVLEGMKTADIRGSKTITNTDIVFLFRNSKLKLKRLYDYFQTINTVKQQKINNDGGILDDEENNSTTKNGGRNNTLDLISSIDVTGEVRAIDFDEVKFQRIARAARLTEIMPLNKYEAYYKARLVSFGKPGFMKTQHKFKAWLNPNNEFSIGQSAYDILVYLAFETVAEIVDLVFLVRQDAKRRPNDPFSKFSAGNYCNPLSLSNAVYIKSGTEGVPPITVGEIREAMRRVYAPNTRVSGYFFRNMRSELPPKFLAI